MPPARRPHPWLLQLPFLALAAAALACAQLAGPAPVAPVPATTAAPVASPTTVAAATTAAPPTTVAAATTAAPVTDTPAPVGAGAPCVIVVRTPPASAPTASSHGTALPQRIDPHVEACASAAKVKVGDTLTVLGQAVDIVAPDYLVTLQDDGAADATTLTEISYDNQVKSRASASQVLSLVSVSANNSSLVLVLHAQAAGHAQLGILAHGEVHLGPDLATIGDGRSEPLGLTVTP